MNNKGQTTWKDALLALLVLILIATTLGKCSDTMEENSDIKREYEELKDEYEDYREEMKREIASEYYRGYDHGYYDAEHGLSYDENRSR